MVDTNPRSLDPLVNEQKVLSEVVGVGRQVPVLRRESKAVNGS